MFTFFFPRISRISEIYRFPVSSFKNALLLYLLYLPKHNLLIDVPNDLSHSEKIEIPEQDEST